MEPARKWKLFDANSDSYRKLRNTLRYLLGALLAVAAAVLGARVDAVDQTLHGCKRIFTRTELGIEVE